jgi:hypothetical protein
LRVFTKTRLSDYVAEHPQLLEYFKNSSYLDTRKTINNVALYILGTLKPPRFVFEYWITRLSERDALEREYPILHLAARTIYLIRRAMDHLLRFDFSTITGKWTYSLWKARMSWFGEIPPAL